MRQSACTLDWPLICVKCKQLRAAVHQRGAQLLAANSGCSQQPVPKAPERLRSQMRGLPARPASLERVCTASCTWSSSLRAARVACLPHFPEQQQRLLLSFECRVCRRACCTPRRGGDRARCSLHVAPHTVTVCMSRPLLCDIGMLQALIACSCRTCGVHEACDLSLKAGRGHGRGACGERVERIVFAT